MLEILQTVLRSVVSALQNRRDLALESVALRHQLVVLQRRSKKPRLKGRDRLVWIALHRLWPDWNKVLVLVQPATVVKWHRAGFRRYWRRKSLPNGGRPKVDADVRNAYHKPPRDNRPGRKDALPCPMQVAKPG